MPRLSTLLFLAGFLVLSGCSSKHQKAEAHPQQTTDEVVPNPAPEPAERQAEPTVAAPPRAPSPASAGVPLPPKPPELRTSDEKADANRILGDYGFSAHQSLTPLCGWRDFNPGGTTWVVDLLTSPLPLAVLREAYLKQMGERGLEGDTWTLRAQGAVNRQLLLQPTRAMAEYPRCTNPLPAQTQTLVVARRAR